MPDKSPTSSSDSLLEPPTARLIIEQPRLSDEALYKCDVTYVKGKCPSISLVRVHMLALPGKAQIVVQRPQMSTAGAPLADGQLVGPYNEHEVLRLTCLVQGGRPQPRSVIWRKIEASGRTVNLAPARFAPSAQQNSRQQAALPDQMASLVQVDLNHTLTSADLGARFECHVEHEALEQPSARIVGSEQSSASKVITADAMLDLHPARPNIEESSNLAAEMNSAPPFMKSIDSHVLVDLNVGVASLDLFMSKVNKRNSSELLNEGDLVELECVAYNSKPPANITWFNGADSIEQLEPSGPIASSSVATANSWQQPSKRSRNKRLLQRNQVHQNPDGLTYTTHSFLSIKLSRHEHRAQISCQAQNEPMRQPMVKRIELQVQHAPIVLMEPAAGIVINELSDEASASGSVTSAAAAAAANDVSIYCIYSANPSDLLANSTRWFKDGQPLLPSSEPQHYSESLTATGYPVLTIHQVKRRHSGLYDCQLTNSVGSSERLATSEACKVVVNFRPSVQLRLFKQQQTYLASARSSNSQQQTGPSTLAPPEELVEVDLSQELVLPGSSFILQCDVLEAQPSKIQKFQWFRSAQKQLRQRQLPAATANYHRVAGLQFQDGAVSQNVIGVTESAQFAIHSLAANFSAASFTCAAFNSLGASNQSNQIELQLSYTPGPSYVRHVTDAALRKTIVSSGKPATQAALAASEVSDSVPQLQNQQPLAAGRELLLECVTSDLGQPSANIWLWFRNGQPIESPSALIQSATNSNNPSANNFDDFIEKDNPIVGQLDLQSTSSASSSISRRTNGSQTTSGATTDDSRQQQQQQQPSHSRLKLIASGRYLYIPSIQLTHKGNYSCVAVNRFGTGQQQAQSSSSLERDSYQLRVALAPSFVQPLPSRTYWPEVQPMIAASATTDQSNNHLQIELVCHVQCEPICQIEWLRNNEPLDLKRQSDSVSSNYVTYQVRQSIMDENLEANLFKSIESTLVLQFHEGADKQSQSSRDLVLRRRHYLSGSNYTCQSSPNLMGHPVRSTTKFIVQYPPENVLINAPSDKLSLVEGSNGPRLSCEATGEPRVQYRWFLVKSSGIDSPSAYAQSGGRQQFREMSSSSAAVEQDQTINQLANRAFHPLARGANDAASIEQDVIELTSSATTDQSTFGAMETPISTLDLSNLSMDKRQSGDYVCEASNKLGQSRQSVHLNVQYKPACAVLHLHSLDLTIAPPLEPFEKDFLRPDLSGRAKPFMATSNDEYSLLKETSEDFVDLRKILVLSPLLNRNQQSYGDEELSFKDSIFQIILNDKKAQDNNLIGSPFTTGTDKSMQLKDKDALIHDDKSDINNQNNLMLPMESGTVGRQSVILNETRTTNSVDSWEKFNVILLNFLNNYIKQVRNHKEEMIENTTGLNENRQTRRSSHSTQDKSTRSTKSDYESAGSSTRNLITFACMAQDANPMSNLSFDWTFGSTPLPITVGPLLKTEMPEFASMEETSKPILVYSNDDNYTVNIWLMRRLDTKSILNPFQMSLITLNVVFEANLNNQTKTASHMTDIDSNHVSASLPKSQANRGKYSSFYNNLKDNQSSNHIRFTHELDLKPYGSGSLIKMNQNNWQEEIGNLLRCSVSNSVGTSDFCNARLNLVERSKSQSSSTEYAKWRMPSLAHKSLLIISVLVGCTILIFGTSALLLGPYLKSLLIKRSDIDHNKVEINTGQSTSSQKSSVLGLLGNGDSSTQGSSDDDSSARMNHDNRIIEQNGLQGRSLSIRRDASSEYHLQRHRLMRDLGVQYDRPRNVLDSQATSMAIGTNLEANTYENYAFQGKHIRIPTDQISENLSAPDSKSSQSSAGSRILANLKLKSITKLKSDRISDLTNLAHPAVNSRNVDKNDVPTSETNTSAISTFGLGIERPRNLDSPGSTTSPPAPNHNNLHYNSSSFRIPVQHKLPQSYYYDQNGLSSESSEDHMLQLNAQRLPGSSSTYSNMVADNSTNALEEFIRRRGIDSDMNQYKPSSFYRAQSVRNTLVNQPNYLLKNTISQFYPQQQNRRPPVYPRTHQAPSYFGPSTYDTRTNLGTQSSFYADQTGIPEQQQYQVNNSYAIAAFNQPVAGRLVQTTNTGFMDTIDSHLNKLTSTIAVSGGLYPESGPNITYANSLGQNVFGHETHSNYNQAQNTTTADHIYDTNTYATPEQTPMRRPNSVGFTSTGNSERPRVSQLIQTFNSKAPE